MHDGFTLGREPSNHSDPIADKTAGAALSPLGSGTQDCGPTRPDLRSALAVDAFVLVWPVCLGLGAPWSEREALVERLSLR
jgi:hypothetical protein